MKNSLIFSCYVCFFFITTSNEYNIFPITHYYCFSICKIIIGLSCRPDRTEEWVLKNEQQEKKSTHKLNNIAAISHCGGCIPHSYFSRDSFESSIIGFCFGNLEQISQQRDSHLTPSACDDRFKLDFIVCHEIPCFFALGNKMTISV